MAIYHSVTKIIGRTSGRSAVGSAAYRAGEKLENERDGMLHDYTRKTGIVHTEIMTPENAPAWAKDRATLWNAVEKVETAKDAQLAREVEVALPNELNREQQKELLREYVKKNFTDKGMVADIALHDKGDANPHAHIMLTMRPFEQDGSWGKKQKKEYILDKNGNKQYDPIKKTYKCKTVKTTDWDKTETLEQWRESWAEIGNRYLERAGHEPTLDHRSYQDQGVEKIPTIHLGPDASAMEKKGIPTDRGDINREITEANKRLEQKEPELTYKLKASEILQEMRKYRADLQTEVTARAQQLTDLYQAKEDLILPYRAAAVEIHVNQKWQKDEEQYKKELKIYQRKLDDYNQGNGYSFLDRLNGKYKKDGEDLHRKYEHLIQTNDNIQKGIKRDRQDLLNPKNYAVGSFEVSKLAHQLAQEQDPDYKTRMEKIQKREARIIADRKVLLPEIKESGNLCRDLRQLKNNEIELPGSLNLNDANYRTQLTQIISQKLSTGSARNLGIER